MHSPRQEALISLTNDLAIEVYFSQLLEVMLLLLLVSISSYTRVGMFFYFINHKVLQRVQHSCDVGFLILILGYSYPAVDHKRLLLFKVTTEFPFCSCQLFLLLCCRLGVHCTEERH